MSSFTDKQWDKSGKLEFIDQCQALSQNSSELRRLLYESCLQVINGLLKPESLINALSEIIGTNSELIIIFLDVLLLCDIETQASENKEQRDLFIWLLGASSNKLVSDSLLKERLDYDTIAEAKIIANRKSAVTKFIKLKTRLFYKQQKFNLFREESEGYAKLITELCQSHNFSCDNMLQVLRSLIGIMHFSFKINYMCVF
jgi:tho2 protein, putative